MNHNVAPGSLCVMHGQIALSHRAMQNIQRNIHRNGSVFADKAVIFLHYFLISGSTIHFPLP